MPEQPRSIIAGTEADQAGRRRRGHRRGRGVRDVPRHAPAAARRLPRRRRRRDRGRQGRDRRGRGRREQPARGPHRRRGRPHHGPAADVRRRRTPRRPPRRPHRPGPARPRAAAARRHPPAPRGARPGRGLRRQQLPARLLHRGWRHRVGAGRRLPGRGQGPPRPPAHRTSRRPRRDACRREVRTCTPGTFSFLLAADARSGIELGQELVADPRIKAVGFTGSRGGGLALVAAAAARPEPIPVYAEMSSINPVVVLPGALAEGDVARSPRRTSARSPWAPASSAPTPACSSCRPATPATRSSPQPAPPSPRPSGSHDADSRHRRGLHHRLRHAPRCGRRPGRGPGQRRRRARTRPAARASPRPSRPR